MALHGYNGLGSGTHFRSLSGFDLQRVSSNMVVPPGAFTGTIADPKLPSIREIRRPLRRGVSPGYEKTANDV